MKKLTSKKLLSIPFLFLIAALLLINLVSSVSVTQLSSNAVSGTRGTAGLVFSQDGLKLVAFDNWDGLNSNQATIYNLNSPFDVSSITTQTDVNLTLVLPENISNYSVSAAYITRNGNNLYLLAVNDSSNTNNGKRQIIVLHYSLSNFDVSSLSFVDELNFTSQAIVGIGFTTRAMGIYVSDSGSELWLSGRELSSGASRPVIWNTTLQQAFNVSTNNSFSSSGHQAFSSNAYASAILLSPDKSFNVFQERDVAQNNYVTAIGLLFYPDLTWNTTSVINTDMEGVTFASTFSNVYLFTQHAGTIYKYQVNNVTFQGSEAQNLSQGQQTLIGQIIDPILSLFPDSNNISFSEKLGIVFLVMLLSAGLILFASSNLRSDGIHTLIIYVVLIILVSEFIFFVAIGYIPFGVLVLLALVAGLFSFFRLKGGSNGGK